MTKEKKCCYCNEKKDTGFTNPTSKKFICQTCIVNLIATSVAVGAWPWIYRKEAGDEPLL